MTHGTGTLMCAHYALGRPSLPAALNVSTGAYLSEMTTGWVSDRRHSSSSNVSRIDVILSISKQTRRSIKSPKRGWRDVIWLLVKRPKRGPDLLFVCRGVNYTAELIRNRINLLHRTFRSNGWHQVYGTFRLHNSRWRPTVVVVLSPSWWGIPVIIRTTKMASSFLIPNQPFERP